MQTRGCSMCNTCTKKAMLAGGPSSVQRNQKRRITRAHPHIQTLGGGGWNEDNCRARLGKASRPTDKQLYRRKETQQPSGGNTPHAFNAKTRNV